MFPSLTPSVAVRHHGTTAGLPQGLQLVLRADRLVELLDVADPELGHHVQQEVRQLRPLTHPVDQLLQLGINLQKINTTITISNTTITVSITTIDTSRANSLCGDTCC